jgi:hypothetical protein
MFSSRFTVIGFAPVRDGRFVIDHIMTPTRHRKYPSALRIVPRRPNSEWTLSLPTGTAMIRLKQPSMAVNDWRMSRDGIGDFHMWNHWRAPQTARPHAILRHIADVAASAPGLKPGSPGGKLLNLVLHGHGAPGVIFLGAYAIGLPDIDLFRQLSGKVERIWFVSCNTALTLTPHPAEVDSLRRNPGAVAEAARLRLSIEELTALMRNGAQITRRIAMAAKSYVVAGITIQDSHRSTPYPFGMIDDFEGAVLTWTPDGVLGDYNTYPIGSGLE